MFQIRDSVCADYDFGINQIMFLFIWKYYPENFVFLTLRILELYARKVCVVFVYKHTETVEYIKK